MSDRTSAIDTDSEDAERKETDGHAASGDFLVVHLCADPLGAS